MSNRFHNLAKRFGDSRPGRQLVAIEDVAIPVTTLHVDVLAQERQQLPITEEFVIRLTAVGITRPGQIASYLGLDDVPVLDAIAAQLQTGTLQRGPSGALRLTALGEATARDIADIKPVERQLPVIFDRLVWRLAPYQEPRLLEKREAVNRGYRLLPSIQSARIAVQDVPVRDFAALIRSQVLEVLRVRRVSTRKHRYLPAQMLVYADSASSDLDLALCLEDRMSNDHGIALSKVDAASRLDLHYEPIEDRPILEPELEAQRVDAHEDELTRGLAASALQVAGMPCRPVLGIGIFDHPALLDRALETAQRRLLVVSPGIRRSVVTSEFLSNLEKRLRRGVLVTIAYGTADDATGSDDEAVSELFEVASRYSQFTMLHLRSNPAKALIFDNTWVSSNFNWLSFSGDLSPVYRPCEGTIVSIPSRVNEEYEKLKEAISQLCL